MIRRMRAPKERRAFGSAAGTPSAITGGAKKNGSADSSGDPAGRSQIAPLSVYLHFERSCVYDPSCCFRRCPPAFSFE